MQIEGQTFTLSKSASREKKEDNMYGGEGEVVGVWMGGSWFAFQTHAVVDNFEYLGSIISADSSQP